MYLPDWAKAMVEYDYNRDHNIVNTSYDGGYSIYNYFETIEEMKKVLSFTNYLKDEELEKILDICQERMLKRNRKEEFNFAICAIIRIRDCSKDFLLKYLDKLNVDVYNDTIKNLARATALDNALSFTNYLKEEELEKILDVCQERISKKTENEEAKRNFKYTIRAIVQRRHCSEDFLLKYLDKLRRFDIIEEHEKEITTGEYSSLVRELELREKYNRINGYLD